MNKWDIEGHSGRMASLQSFPPAKPGRGFTKEKQIVVSKVHNPVFILQWQQNWLQLGRREEKNEDLPCMPDWAVVLSQTGHDKYFSLSFSISEKGAVIVWHAY